MGLVSKKKFNELTIILITFLYLFITISSIIKFGAEPLYKTPDAIHYEMMAKQLVNKGIYGYAEDIPNAFVTPTYPLFLAAIYWLTGFASKEGGPYLLIRIIQAVFGALSLYLVFLLAKRTSTPRIGLIAALLLALHPSFLRAPIFLLTESLSAFLFLLYIYVQLIALERRDARLSLIAGVIFGLAALARPSVFIVLGVPFAIEWFSLKREGLKKVFLLTLAGFALIMLPWIARNLIVLKTAAPFSTHGGDPLLSGVDPYHYELGREYNHRGPTYKRFIKEQPKGETMTSYAIKSTIAGFKRDPILYFKWFTWGKFWRMFEAPWLTLDRNAYRSIVFIHYMIIILGWVGVVLSAKVKRMRPISLIIALFTIGLLPFMAETRFVFIVIPLLALMAAETLIRAWGPPDV